MSRLTREDALVSKLLPAVRATRPASDFRRAMAVRHAVTDDGHINADALLLDGNLLIGDDVSSATMANTSSSTYMVYIETSFTLPDGIWRVALRGAVTASLSTASNLNSQAVINGQASTNNQIPIAAANQLATVFTRYQLDNVAGGETLTLQIQFRPSAGTATAESGFYSYVIQRTG